MRFLFVIGFILLFFAANAQKVVNVRYQPSEPTIDLSVGVQVPTLEPGYTLWLPKGGKVKGLIVFPFQRRDSVEQTAIIKNAMKQSIAVMYTSTDNPIEFLFDDKKTESLADDILRVCQNFSIPDNQLLYAGSSLAGMRALKLAIYTMQNKKYKSIVPKALAIVDVPLDMHRLYHHSSTKKSPIIPECIEAPNFSIAGYLSANLDGNPTNSKARYASFSPYSKYVRNGGNAGYFTSMHIRAYVDDDTNWNNDKLGGNFYDMSSFINQLKLLGNDKVELLPRTSKKKSQDAWDLIDDRELVTWFRSNIEI